MISIHFLHILRHRTFFSSLKHACINYSPKNVQLQRLSGCGLNCILILSPLCLMTQLPNIQWKIQIFPCIRFQLKQHVLADKQPSSCHVAVQSIRPPAKNKTKRRLCFVTECTYRHIMLDDSDDSCLKEKTSKVRSLKSVFNAF